jgi:L-ribulose-5-phosphate 4-epimerase
MSYSALKELVCRINRELPASGLVVLTWGNGSAVDRKAGVMAIKPSGVAYDKLKPSDIVVLSLKNGRIVEGKFRPSSDTATHLHLYQSWPSIGGIVHTHSLHATSFCQAALELPCLGTTHADNFHGTVPVTRHLTRKELAGDYELNTGKVITECFTRRKLDPDRISAVFVAGHAPFTWGATADKALENSIVLEFASHMAINTAILNPRARPIPQPLHDKHFLRKHGPRATYGQS